MDRKHFLERLIEASTLLGVETHRLAVVGSKWVWQSIVQPARASIREAEG
jgi:hypothetical protein